MRQRLGDQSDVWLFNAVLILDGAQEVCRCGFQRIRFVALDRHGGKGFTRNCVAQRTAAERQQTQIQISRVCRQEARQQFVGVAEAHVNIGTRVTATQAFQRQLQGLELSRHGFTGQRQGGDEVDTACTTHVDLTFFFGVGVDQDFSLQPVGLQTESAIHACLFSHGQQHFQRAVRQAVVSQHRQRRSHTDAVVRTQRGAACFYPLAVNPGLNRVFREVMNGVVIFLRHHVQMRLQRNRGTVFHACGGGLTNQDVADLIALTPEALLFSPAGDVVRQRFFVKRGMGNRADLSENIPQWLWRELRQFRHDRSPVSVYRRGRTSRVSSEKSPSENLTSQA